MASPTAALLIASLTLSQEQAELLILKTLPLALTGMEKISHSSYVLKV